MGRGCISYRRSRAQESWLNGIGAKLSGQSGRFRLLRWKSNFQSTSFAHKLAADGQMNGGVGTGHGVGKRPHQVIQTVTVITGRYGDCVGRMPLSS